MAPNFVDISFGVDEIYDMVVAPKAEIVKTLLRRLKYYQDQSKTADASDEESKDSKNEFAVDQAIRRTKSIYENKSGMRPN